VASIATGMNLVPIQMLATAAVNCDKSLAQMAGHPWRPMMNGTFQQVLSEGPHAPSCFPIPPPGYHYGLIPNLVFPQFLNAEKTQKTANSNTASRK
jgi:hypothetical protein